jgi:Protein of unknown function (DUF4239)
VIADLNAHSVDGLPDWGLALVIVGGTVIVVLLGLAVVNRWLPAWRSESSSQTVAGVVAMVMTMFAVLVAFVIVNLFNSYEGASNNVANEAASLADLVRDARHFPAPVRQRIERAVANYVVEVRQREFHTLSMGQEDARAQQLLGNIFEAVQTFSPRNAAQQAFYSDMIQQLHSIADERENRLDAAEAGIPKPLLYLMILLAVLTLAAALFIDTHHDGLDVAVVVTLAIAVSAGMLTAVILQHPFSGSIAVSSDPFGNPSLARLVQTYG